MHGEGCLKHTPTCLYTVLINVLAFTGVNCLFVSVGLCALLYLLFCIHISCTIMQTLNSAPDYFVLCGKGYLDMREALTQSIVDKSADHFKQHVKVNAHHVQWFLQRLC